MLSPYITPILSLSSSMKSSSPSWELGVPPWMASRCRWAVSDVCQDINMSFPLLGISLSRILQSSQDLVTTVASFFFFFISQNMNLKLYRELRVFLVFLFPLVSFAQIFSLRFVNSQVHIHLMSNFVENVHLSSGDLTLR